MSEEVEHKLEKQQQAKPESGLKAFADNLLTYNYKTASNIKDKPEGRINPAVLRAFSINYPIARACIDYLKTKVTQLDWDIVPFDEEMDEVNPALTRELKKFFRKPSGEGSSFREFQEMLIEDFLVFGTVSIERARTRGGELIQLLPVDAGTIKVRILENGRRPKPPEIAFEQWIHGVKTAELTTDDLIFEIRNARTNSPFGLSPLESLIVQVQSALEGAVYNLKYFTDSNLVEGFGELPEEWTSDQIKEFQRHFDRMVAGDPRAQRKMKFMPKGFNYTATKKPEDMAFEKFELWLLQQTCAVFGVPPQDIGFTHQINKSSSETQAEKGEERGKRPVAMFLAEVFTDVVQSDLGYQNLRFAYINVDPVDRKTEAEVDDIRLRTGIVSIDEIRRREGLEELGVDHFILTSQGPTFLEGLKENQMEMRENMKEVVEPQEEPEEEEEDETEKLDAQVEEIKQWKRFVVNDFKRGNDFRDFTVYKIDDTISKDIRAQLKDVESRDDIEAVFAPYLTGEYETILKLRSLRDELQRYL